MDNKTEEVTSINETKTHVGGETGAEDEVEILDRNVAKTVMGVLHCECDLKSVITLRVHCGGTQHIRKVLQKKKE